MIKRTKREEPGLPEGIYGLTEPPRPSRTKRKVVRAKVNAPLTKIKKTKSESARSEVARTSKKPKRRKTLLLKGDEVSYISGLNIQYDRLELPAAASGLPLENAVSISEDLLKYVKAKTELRTKNLSNLILRNVIPSMVACDASLAYTKTFLEAGFGFESAPDDTIPDSLGDLVRFEVLSYFIRVSKLPKSVKVKLLDALTERFADQILATIRDSLNKKKLSDKVKDMEAFVMRTRSDNKVTTSNRGDQEPQAYPARGSLKRRSGI